MEIRGVKVDHSTLQRWVFKFSPEIEKNIHKRKYKVGDSWRIRESMLSKTKRQCQNETYVKVGGKDRFLYRAVDKEGNTVYFLLTKRRQKMSAQKFFNKAIGNNGDPGL